MKKISSSLRDGGASSHEGAADVSSDSEGRRSRAVGLSGTAEKGKEVRPSADRMRIGVDPFRQGGRVGRDQRRRLYGKPAERALVVAAAGGRGRRAFAVS